MTLTPFMATGRASCGLCSEPIFYGDDVVPLDDAPQWSARAQLAHAACAHEAGETIAEPEPEPAEQAPDPKECLPAGAARADA